MRKVLITNNPMVFEKYNEELDTIYLNANTYLDVLLMVRNKIHQGHRLLTHPLSGSVKPNETPYKSIIVSKDRGNLDMDSLEIIEGSIDAAKKLIDEKKTPKWSEKILQDFQLIDFYLIKGGIESMVQF